MKNRKRFLSLGCTAALVISLVGVNSGMKTSVASDLTEVEEIQDTLEELENASGIVSHSDTAGKEETVYAILDGNGNREQTIVSEWLKNAEGNKTLNDNTSLSDIVVVKGDAEYTKGTSEDQIVWSTDGSDVYYQGTSDKKLPVEVSISYELDGKKVSAEELAGKSGHLKLVFTYTNNEYKETMINGQRERIYQPFMMVSGMMLDNTKVTNVTVDNGSMVNTGDDILVFGIAMPGLAESLGLEDAEIEIPETVTVEADVIDFSLMMTLTVASNRALSQFGLDDIDTIDDLKADMDELTNGMQEIVDGATKLSDGTGELADGTDELVGGATELTAGVGELKEKVPDLSNGVNALKAGTTELASGVKELTDKNEELTSGMGELESGLEELGGSLNSKESATKINALTEGSASFSEGMEEAAEGLSQIVTGYNYENKNLQALIGGLTQYANGLAATGDPTNQAYAGYINQMIETYKGLYNSVAKVQGGIATLSGAYGDIDAGIRMVVGSLSQVSDAVNKLSAGAKTLNNGVNAYTTGVTAVANGVVTLDEGVAQLNAQVPNLSNGVSALYDGANALKTGTIKLNNGTASLTEGVDALKDGVIKFDEEGIQKLADVVNGDLQTYFDRIKALQDYAEEYTSYAGCEDGVECSVKFIYKTGEVKDTSGTTLVK